MIKPAYYYAYKETKTSKVDKWKRVDNNSHNIKDKLVSFEEFFKGTIQTKSNHSVIKYLPNDVIEMIWEEYILQTFSIAEIIENGFNHVYKKYNLFHENHIFFLCKKNPCLLKEIFLQKQQQLITTYAHLECIFKNLIQQKSFLFSNFLFFYNLAKPLSSVDLQELNTKIFTLACNHHRLEVVEFMLENFIYKLPREPCQGPHIFFNYSLKIDIINASLTSSSLDVVKAVYAHFEWSNKTVIHTNIMSLDILIWLIENNLCAQTIKELGLQKLFCAAAENGNLEMLVWLSEKFCLSDWTWVLEASLRLDHEQIAKWICEKHLFLKQNNTLLDVVCKTNNLDLLFWLHKKTKLCVSCDAMYNAALNKNLELMKWLHLNRPEYKKPICSIETMEMAIENNDFEMARWLYENRSEIRNPSKKQILVSYFYLLAAESGNLELLMWLHEKYGRKKKYKEKNPCFQVYDGAAQYGHVHILKWLYENKVGQFFQEAFFKAARNGNVDVLDWFVEMFPEEFALFSQEMITRLMMTACFTGHLNVVKWIQSRASDRIRSCNDFIDQAAVSNQLHIVEWLVKNRKQDGFSKKALTRTFDIRIINLLKNL